MQKEPAVKRAVYALLPDLRAIRERPLLPVCVYMVLGIAAGAFVPLPKAACFIALASLVIACLLLHARKKDITLPVLLAAFAAGCALISAALPGWAGDPWAPEGEARVSGRIVKAGTTRGGYASFVLDDVTVDGSPVAGRVAVTARGAPAGGAGDILKASVELERPRTSRYHGDFNARGWYMRQGVRFTAFATAPEIERTGAGDTVWNLPERARLYADGVLKRYLSPDSAALVDALLSGDTSDISLENRNAFRDLGVAHLLAVSGLNITLTAGAAWLLCRKLRILAPVSLGISFAVLLGYVLFAGPGPPVLRAAVMWAVMMGGYIAARRYDPLSSISAAAIVILALNPLDLFDAGFQLSFAATAAIFLWHAPVMKHAPRKKVLKAFFASASLTICATLLALPIILGCFNQISPISPLANLLLVPASFVMQLGGTALVFTGFLPGVASMLGDALDWYAAFYLRNVAILEWSAAPLVASTPALWLSAAYVALALLASPSAARFKPGGRAAVVVALAAAAALMLSPVSPALTWHSETAAVAEGSSSLGVWWRAGDGDYAACGKSWDDLSGYLQSRGISRLKGLYVLSASPPEDGSMLLTDERIRADTLWVPARWLDDPEAKAFLEQAAVLGMRPAPAEEGPCPYLESGASAVLSIPAAGGTLAFVPYASGRDFGSVSGALVGAYAVALNVPASRAGGMTGEMTHQCLILPGAVERTGAATYNSSACGSIEVENRGGAVALVPWTGGWADGIQGNFR